VRGHSGGRGVVACCSLGVGGWRGVIGRTGWLERFAGALGYSLEYHLVPAKKSKRRQGIVVES
jgi:hypothetical protein